MPIPFIPVAVIVITGIAGYVQYNRKSTSRGMTAKEQEIYAGMLNSPLDADKYEKMAAIFEGQGFKEEAQLLRKRGALRGLSPEEKDKRRDIFKKAMRSTNIEGLEMYAKALHNEGALGAEATVLKRIAGLPPVAQGESSPDDSQG
jgi:hypothetical protein